MRGFARPTLKDVANLSGVSEITASRVMRGAPNTSAKTRLKVEAAARQLDYAPNRLAGSLASQSTDLLAVIIPSMTHSVFSEVIDGIDSVLSQTQYRTVLGISRYSQEREAVLVSDLLSWNPAGIVLAGCEHAPEAQRALTGFQNPVIEIMDADGQPIDSMLGVSHTQAGIMMADHLTDRGYRRIGYLGAWGERPSRSRKRRAAFEQRLEERGSALHGRIIRDEDSSMALGKCACAQILERHPNLDALFCANDDLAAGALLHCLSHGIRVPDTLALAGFNGLLLTDAMPQRLTTIVTPRYEMGVSTAELFLQRHGALTASVTPQRVVMPLVLRQGETT